MKNLVMQIRDAVILHHSCPGDHCINQGCQNGEFAGCLVRLVGHDFMDFKPSLGSIVLMDVLTLPIQTILVCRVASSMPFRRPTP